MSFPNPSFLPRARPRAGFTMLEIILVIALVGLLAGLTIGVSSRMLATEPDTAEGVFWTALAEARREAMLQQREVRLRYDADKRALLAASAAGERAFPLPPGEVRLDFLVPVATSSGRLLIGGTLVETQTLPHVTFFDDGTCTPFRLQVRNGADARTVSIDPWTCSEILVAAK